MSEELKLWLVKSLIIPYIDYCDTVFTNVSASLQTRLDRIMNSCIRFVCCLRKFDHISVAKQNLDLLTGELRRKTHFATLVYKIFRSRQPKYLYDKLMFSDHSYETRTKDNPAIPKHRTVCFESSFTYLAPKIWNELPESIRLSNSVELFQRNVEKFYAAKLSMNWCLCVEGLSVRVSMW